MKERWNITTLSEVRDREIVSRDGEKIGTIRDIYYDDFTQEPEWVSVGTGFLGMSEKVVPVEVLQAEGDRFRVPFTKDKIKEEPEFNLEDGRLRSDDEVKLCRHFGLSGDGNRTTRVLRYGETYKDRM
jgi:hypothetical protein